MAVDNIKETRSFGLFNMGDLDDGLDITNDSPIISEDSREDNPLQTTLNDQDNSTSTNTEDNSNDTTQEVNQEETTEQVDNTSTTNTEEPTEFSYQPLLETFFKEGVLPDDLEITDDITDDLDGFKLAVTKGLELKANKIIEERDSKLSEETRKRIAIESSGGSIQELYGSDEIIDFNALPLDADSESDISEEDALNNQKFLYSEYLADLGTSEEEIETLINESEVEGTLKGYASIAKKALTKRDEEKVTAYISKKKEEEITQKQAAIKAEEDFKNYVTNLREIGSFQIDKTKSEKLYNFLTKRDKDGKTEADKKFTQENAMLFQFLLMEGFDKIDTFRKKAETDATKILKKTLHKFKPNTNTGLVVREEEQSTSKKQIIPSFWGNQ